MSVDLATVKRVARLARIAVSEEEAERMTGDLNGILGFIEQLDEVDVTGVEPMTSVIPMEMKKRKDIVTDGNKAATALVDPAITADPAVYPDAATLARMYTPAPQTEEQDREITRIWATIKSGG